MKISYFFLIVLISFPSLLVDRAYGAYAARRTAVVARGPNGGVVAASRRTAIVRPGYHFDGNRSLKSDVPGSHQVQGVDRVKPVAEGKQTSDQE